MFKEQRTSPDAKAATPLDDGADHLPGLELPGQIFVGRQEPLQQLQAGLADPTVQLIYQLQGSGGIGKTCLARELARRCGTQFERVVELLAETNMGTFSNDTFADLLLLVDNEEADWLWRQCSY